MDANAVLLAPCEPAILFPWVDDLSRFPQWMSLVHRVSPADAAPADPGPAWNVELRGRIGPLARSKRLRMVRSVNEPHHHVRFERAELDGRSHAAWTLDATLAPEGSATRLRVELHYGGALWTAGILERALGDHIEAGRTRLSALVATTQ